MWVEVLYVAAIGCSIPLWLFGMAVTIWTLIESNRQNYISDVASVY